MGGGERRALESTRLSSELLFCSAAYFANCVLTRGWGQARCAVTTRPTGTLGSLSRLRRARSVDHMRETTQRDRTIMHGS